MIKLYNQQQRNIAIEAIRNAPDGSFVEVKPSTRSIEQNAKFHALCADVSRQSSWLGKKLSPEQWKVLFISGHAIASGLKAELVPGIEGEFVNIRESSARMSVSRMTSLIEYVIAWCSENDVLCRFDEVHYANENERKFNRDSVRQVDC